MEIDVMCHQQKIGKKQQVLFYTVKTGNLSSEFLKILEI